MGYLPPEKKDKDGVSGTRMLLWIAVAAVGLWLVGSGVVGLIGNG